SGTSSSPTATRRSRAPSRSTPASARSTSCPPRSGGPDPRSPTHHAPPRARPPSAWGGVVATVLVTPPARSQQVPRVGWQSGSMSNQHHSDEPGPRPTPPPNFYGDPAGQSSSPGATDSDVERTATLGQPWGSPQPPPQAPPVRQEKRRG